MQPQRPRRSTNHLRRRRTMVNGRLVGSGGGTLRGSLKRRQMKRGFILLLVLSILWLTNPVGYVGRSFLSSRYSKKIKHLIAPISTSNKCVAAPALVNNYGILALHRCTRHIVIHVGGQAIPCSYSDKHFASVCKYLRKTSLRPLIWDPKDRPFTTYRVLFAILFLANILPWILGGVRGPKFLSQTFSIFRSSSPPGLTTALGIFLQFEFFLSPCFSRLDELISTQNRSSWFRIFESLSSSVESDKHYYHDGNDKSDKDANYILALLFMLSVAAASNNLTRRFLGEDLCYQALVSLFMGYTRGASGEWTPPADSYASMASSTSSSTFSIFNFVPSLESITDSFGWNNNWSDYDDPSRWGFSDAFLYNALFCLLLRNIFDYSLANVLVWMVVNMMGAQIGYYQYRHSSVWTDLAYGVWGVLWRWVDGGLTSVGRLLTTSHRRQHAHANHHNNNAGSSLASSPGPPVQSSWWWWWR